jgi:hypothetical protein
MPFKSQAQPVSWLRRYAGKMDGALERGGNLRDLTVASPSPDDDRPMARSSATDSHTEGPARNRRSRPRGANRYPVLCADP